jgi:amino acid transporter
MGLAARQPEIGWVFGWLTFCYLVIGVVAVNSALASTAFMPLVGLEKNENVARLITLVMLVIQAVLAIASTRIVAMINSAAVGVEVVIVVALVIALGIAVAITGEGSAANLTSRGITENAPNYFAVGGGLMMAMIMGLTTITGFEAAANLAEEAEDPYRSVPRAIVGSVVVAGLLGMLFLIALTFAMHDIPRVSASDVPVAVILRDQLGPVMERTLLVAVTFAFFGAGMVTLTTCSRIVYAMARDSRFPAHQLMRRVDPRTQTPIPATILILVVGVVLMVATPGAALVKLITASTILPALLYGSTTILYLAVRKRLDRKEGGFDLGRFELPVAIGALVWCLFALLVLVAPAQAFIPVIIVVGLLAGGGVYFLYLLIRNRNVLATETNTGSI